MSLNRKRPGVALLSVILISAILVTGGAIVLSRASTERQITSSDLAFREALGVAETGVSMLLADMRSNSSPAWVQFLDAARYGSETTLTSWQPWLFKDEETDVLVTRGSYVRRLTTSAAVPVASDPEHHQFDTAVVVSSLGRAFAPSIAAGSVTNPASQFMAQRAVETSAVIRWQESYTVSQTTTTTATTNTYINAAVFSNSSILLAGHWGVIKGDVHSNSTIEVQDAGGSITDGHVGAWLGVTGFLPPGTVQGEPIISAPDYAAARDENVTMYQKYINAEAPFDGSGEPAYENSSPYILGMPAYIASLVADPANTALWTHLGGAYYADAAHLGTVKYQGVDYKGINLKSDVRAKIVVVDGSLIMDGGSITADLIVVTGDMIRANGGGVINGTVLLQGAMKGNGNFTLRGSLIAGGHLDLSGSISIDHTGAQPVPVPTIVTTTTTVNNVVDPLILAAFLPTGAGSRVWHEVLPSGVLGE